MPLTVDLQISAQVAFPLEPGFLKQANAPCILWNTGCFDTVQLKPCEDIGNNQLKCGEHMALAGITLAHPIADHAALGGTPADIADGDAADERHVLLLEDEERDR